MIVPDYFGPEDPLYVNFLPGVLGLEDKDVARHSEVLEAEASDGHSVEVRVAHPVHVLFGVVENYLRLPARRNDETLARVDRLIPDVGTYIRRVAEQSAMEPDPKVARALEREARWSMQALFGRSATPAYARFTIETDRDLLRAIPADERTPVGEAFWSKEFSSSELSSAARSREDATAAKPS